MIFRGTRNRTEWTKSLKLNEPPDLCIACYTWNMECEHSLCMYVCVHVQGSLTNCIIYITWWLCRFRNISINILLSTVPFNVQCFTHSTIYVSPLYLHPIALTTQYTHNKWTSFSNGKSNSWRKSDSGQNMLLFAGFYMWNAEMTRQSIVLLIQLH